MNFQNIVLIIGLSLFLIATAVELVFAFIENERLRKIVKVFPVLILAVTMTIVFPEYPLIYLAIYCGFLGDLLLIFEKQTPFFFIGGAIFLVGHILYLLNYLSLSTLDLPWYTYIIATILFILLVVIAYLKLNHKMKLPQVFVGAIYFFTLGIGIMLTLYLGFTHSTYFFITTIGYLMFLISDALLSKKNFDKEYKRDDFYIMLTYLLAQVLIVISQSLILLY